jgi:hypothetical protein
MTKERNKTVVARSLLKHSCIRIEKKGGKSVFVFPKQLAETLGSEYKFSLKQLCVGGEISLHDLAIHMDHQASFQAEVSIVAEQARLLKELAELDFERWHESLCHKIRMFWHEENNKWPSQAEVKGKILAKYGKEYQRRKEDLASLEATYRILQNVIHSAVIVKGDMLRSLRPLIQSDGSVITGGIDVKVAQPIRKSVSLIVEKEKSDGGKEKQEKQVKEKQKRKGKAQQKRKDQRNKAGRKKGKGSSKSK